MNGTFTPQPGAAPLPRQVLAQTRMETKLLLRNGEQLLLAIIIPVLVLFGNVSDYVGRRAAMLAGLGALAAGSLAFGLALVLVMVLRPQGLVPSRRRAAEIEDRRHEAEEAAADA